MHNILVYVLIALVYKTESLTFCDDPKCVCLNKDQDLKISCSSHSTVLEKYNLFDNVTILNLSRNNLTRIQRPLVSDTLIELLLNNNQIEEIANGTLRLPLLKIFDLSHNNLKFIHRDTFSQIKQLEYLNLTNNKFCAFGNINFYHLKKLREIIFDDNNIGPSLQNYTLFEGGYDLTKEIESISLRNVNLTSNNKHIFLNESKYSIQKLILAQNNMTDFIDLPDNLVYLDLSSNPIKQIPRDAFLFTIYLSVLKLNNIHIKEVQDFAFFYLCSLRHLELENNYNLKYFSPLAWGRVIVKDQIDLFVENLTLRGSNLSSLDGQMAGIFQKIKRVDLRDNPWNCDCNITWLQNIQIPDEFMDFRCSTPSHLFNKKILEINSTEFTCEEQTPSGNLNSIATIAMYSILLTFTVLVMYFFVFSPKPFFYRQLPPEFPRTP